MSLGRSSESLGTDWCACWAVSWRGEYRRGRVYGEGRDGDTGEGGLWNYEQLCDI